MTESTNLLALLEGVSYSRGLMLERTVAALDEEQIAADFALSRFSLVASKGGEITEVGSNNDKRDHSARTDFFDYHFDGAYLASPPQMCALYCVNAGRGDSPTSFVDTRDVIKSLEVSGITLATLSKLDWLYCDRNNATMRVPLLRNHPISGDATLALSIESGWLADRTEENSCHSSKELATLWKAMKVAIRSVPVRTHYWKNNQLVIWDNLSYLHARLAKSPDDARRMLRFWFTSKTHA